MNFVYLGTAENFESRVVDNSKQGPLTVNFCSPAAAPNRIQTDGLVKRTLRVLFSMPSDEFESIQPPRTQMS